MQALLNSLHDNKIIYCHFKSNANLFAGLSGSTDMDILVDKTQRTRCLSVLAANGFKLFRPIHYLSYPAVEDWLGYDSSTGKLLHLHLHWELIAGRADIKEYHLPWESLLLDTRIYNDNNNIYTSSVEAELLLLIIRICIKCEISSYLKHIINRYPDKNTLHELQWLVDRVDKNIFSNLLNNYLGTKLMKIILGHLDSNQLNSKNILRNRNLIKNQVKSYRRYSSTNSAIHMYLRRGSRKLNSYIARYFNPLIVRRRTPSSGGMIIVLIGIDGSGKSTLAEELRKWLAWKIDVVKVYFGTGKNVALFLRKLLSIYKTVNYKFLNKRIDEKTSQDYMFNLLYAFFAIRTAMIKLNTAVRINRAASNGMVVICDRYPQAQSHGYNDGLLLAKKNYEESSLRYLSSLEKDIYNKIHLFRPQLMIYLKISAEKAHERKSEMPYELLSKKAKAIEELSKDNACKTRVINAEESFDAVYLASKQQIWDLI